MSFQMLLIKDVPNLVKSGQNYPIVAGIVFLRRVRTLCVALHTARNSPVHSNGVINYAITIRFILNSAA